jgi:hypothetical protein
MDPNAALKNIREAVGELRNQDDDGVLDGTSQVGFLLESVEALDEWLTKGGFLPDAWSTQEEQRILSVVNDWTDEEFQLALGFPRPKPGPGQPGSIGETGPDGRMNWRFKGEGD